MNRIGEEVATILTAVIGVAILAVILSKRSNTTGVIDSGAKGFSSILSTALSPITGGAGIAIN